MTIDLFGNEIKGEVWAEERTDFIKTGISTLDDDAFLTIGHVHFFLFTNEQDRKFMNQCFLLIAGMLHFDHQACHDGKAYTLSCKRKVYYENCTAQNFKNPDLERLCDYARINGDTIITVSQLPPVFPNIPINCTPWVSCGLGQIGQITQPYKRHKLFI